MHFKRGENMERFMMLYETVYKDLYRLAYYYLGNSHDAEDIVGETVLKAYENFKKLRNEEAFRGWIFKILINQCNTKLRNKINRKTVELNESVSYESNLDEKVIVRELLAELSNEERQIVVLSVFGGYKGEEIARMLNKRHSTIRSKYRRALKKLEQKLLKEEVQYERS